VESARWVLLGQQGTMGPQISNALEQLLLMMLMLLLLPPLLELATQQARQRALLMVCTLMRGTWQGRLQILWTLCVL
jgi:hypothetical protein